MKKLIYPLLNKYSKSKELKISPDKFGKITVVPSQGKGAYKKKSQFGICTAQGNNIKLRKLVLNKIEELREIA